MLTTRTPQRRCSSLQTLKTADVLVPVPRRYTLPSQSHFYMETQNAVAEPDEDGTMRVWSSTQTMDGVQSAVARVLGVPAHSVDVGAPASAHAALQRCVAQDAAK